MGIGTGEAGNERIRSYNDDAPNRTRETPCRPAPTQSLHRSSIQRRACRRCSGSAPTRSSRCSRPSEEGAGTVYRVRIEPHSRTAVSYHKIAEEYYFVLAGRGVAILDGKPQPLATGDFLRLPPGTTHGFVTEDEGLDMLDIHTPGSRPDRDVYFVGDVPPGFGKN